MASGLSPGSYEHMLTAPQGQSTNTKLFISTSTDGWGWWGRVATMVSEQS